MIVTQRKRIPWSWVFMVSLPYFGFNLVEVSSFSALTFTMKKFISEPALLTFIASLNIAFNFMVAPFVSWKSDRIWTRFGRRKPFIVCGWIGLIVSLVFVPLAPNIWTLVVAIIFYQFFQDFAFTGPYEPLLYEVVPLPQRGRASAMLTFFRQAAALYFNFFLIKQFYEVYSFGLNLGFLGLPTIQVNGERLIYWGAAAVIAVLVIWLAYGLKETPVENNMIGERFSVLSFLRGMFGERQLRLIYLLIFTQISMNTGLMALEPLLIKEQFGYSMSMLGNIHGVNILLQILFVIPVAGFLADRIDRLKLFQLGLGISMVQPLAYFFFVKFVAENQIPTPPVIVGFTVFGSLIHLLANIAMGPLLFDHVPKNKMGTVYAGMTFVRGMVKLVVANGVGIWVSLCSRLTRPAGEFDYMTGYLYIFAVGLMGFLCSLYFAHERRHGRIVEFGRLELEAAQAQDSATKDSSAS